MSKVVLVRCETYEPGKVRNAVARGIDLLGGRTTFVKPGEKILLKPNWIVASNPAKCAVTHPSVFEAVALEFKEAGAILSYGDSPSHHTPETASLASGFTGIASKLGIPLADFRSGKDIVYDRAIQNKRFHIAKGVLASDGIISLPKLKTHGFLKLTGAIKNQFGCVPGVLKAEFHLKLTSALDFAKMLVDLTSFLKPRLYIMDGIIAMEGNGPMGGEPRKLGVLLFSTDPVALDATVCRILKVNPELSHTITAGKEAGLGTFLENEIELLGDPIASFTDPDFSIDREPIPEFKMGGGALRLINNMLVPKPFIVDVKCIKCGDCVAICPARPKALNWHNGDKTRPPSFDYDKCIRCYCCQEICPRGAIELKIPFIRQMIGGIPLPHGKKPVIK